MIESRNADELGSEIAHVLADSIVAALAPSAPAETWRSARDAAQLLSLEGLDHALAVCELHAGRALPAEVAPIAGRLDRYAAQARASGDLAIFREHDAELRALADEAGGVEWSESDSGSAVATLGAAEALGDITLASDADQAALRRTRITPSVAAALRAALDWLLPDHATAPIRLSVEPSALQIRLDRVRFDRMRAVDRVIAGAGGNLGPTPEGPSIIAPWILRVPAFAARPSYLMVERGGVRTAIPWHAVLELRMAPATDAVSAALPLAHDVIDASSSGAPRPEHPVVLVAHGLKRGYLPVDRLIWRMAATPCDAPAGAEAVATDDGEVFVVASPEQLLAAIDTPSFQAHPVFDATPRVPTLTRANVVPLPGPVAPAAAPTPAAAPIATALAPTSAPPRPAEALVAEDSIAARLFLVRLLEQQGLVVTSVATSSQLMRRLGERPWAIVLTDLELPDAHGEEWLRAVTAAAAALPEPPRVVALVRDRADLDIARAAEVADTLLKPFGREPLAALLARAGLPLGHNPE